MADHATLTHGLVLKRERTGLLAMTLGAGFVHARHGESAFGFENVSAVGIVALHAVHPVFHDGMMVRQVELGVGFQMALKTGLRRFARVDNGVARAARLIVKAPGTVAGFAARIFGVVSRRLQSRVGGRSKIAINRFVTLRTGL